VNQLTAPGIPTIYYGPDGEGCVNSVTGGQNSLLSSTVYNTAGEPYTLTFGTGDSDNYRHDPNTLRMTQYQHTVNGNNVTGNLTWNDNGSLKTLSIADDFNSSNAQTCTYGYDDLGRIRKVDCGSAWVQTFGPNPGDSNPVGADVFGNLSKTGSNHGTSFQPTYTTNPPTNQIQGYSYDVDGFVENTGSGPGSTVYNWDADGHVTCVTPYSSNSITMTYDALGRVVEKGGGGNCQCTGGSCTHTQFVYGPLGDKVGLMNGQTVVSGRVPLAAGAVAKYTAGPTLAAYWHTDWQGSVRFASTPGRTMYYDAGIAPFGEHYAETGSSTGVFGGMIQDTVVGMYDTPNREYDTISGRWLSPDPAGLAAVDLTNPQSLNRYAYVMNNPTTLVDPSGLDPFQPCQSEFNCPPGNCLPDIDGFCIPAPPCDPVLGCAPPPVGGGPPPMGGSGGASGGGGGTAPGGSGTGGGGAGPFPGGGPICGTFGACGGMPPGFVSPAIGTADESAPFVFDVTVICALTPGCLETVAGVAAGVLVYKGVQAGIQIYNSRRTAPNQAENEQVRRIAREFCVSATALGNAVHDYKKRYGSFPLTEEELEELARTLPKIPGCTPTKE